MLDIRYWITEVAFQNYWGFYRTSNIQYLLKQGGYFCREVLVLQREILKAAIPM
jgi:hypothetical protein